MRDEPRAGQAVDDATEGLDGGAAAIDALQLRHFPPEGAWNARGRSIGRFGSPLSGFFVPWRAAGSGSLVAIPAHR
jgi:hypothetical protein